MSLLIVIGDGGYFRALPSSLGLSEEQVQKAKPREEWIKGPANSLSVNLFSPEDPAPAVEALTRAAQYLNDRRMLGNC